MARRLLLALLVLAVCAPAASAFRLADDGSRAVRGNPADRMLRTPIEVPVYDSATRCRPRAAIPGTTAFVGWLQRNARGVFWGSYRCERWGRGSASLHAEKRAVDWALDASSAADRRAARALILVLLAPDRNGNPQALARRMGIQEIIWDCSYWGAGMADFGRYRTCFEKDGEGRRRRGVDASTAHRNHIHFGLTKAGAAGRTSFWQR